MFIFLSATLRRFVCRYEQSGGVLRDIMETGVAGFLALQGVCWGVGDDALPASCCGFVARSVAGLQLKCALGVGELVLLASPARFRNPG